MHDDFSLSVFANSTLYCSLLLVFITCDFLFSGKRSFKLLCFIPDFANLSVSASLLSYNDSMFRIINALSYEVYFSLSSILQECMCCPLARLQKKVSTIFSIIIFGLQINF